MVLQLWCLDYTWSQKKEGRWEEKRRAKGENEVGKRVRKAKERVNDETQMRLVLLDIISISNNSLI
jgi:hypothetical protein